jgi:hypothetical protein
MVRILTKLRVDEISSVTRGAGEGVKIVLMKLDNGGGKAMVDKPANFYAPQRPLLFNDFMKLRKLSEAEAAEDVRDEDDDDKVEPKLRAWARLMVVVDPSRTEEEHLYRLTQTAHGQAVARHLNELSKGAPPMLDIRKLIPVLEEGLLARAKLEKRDGESDAKAFSRIYENDIDFRKQWQTVTEAKHRIALSKSLPNIMSTTPTSTEVGNTNVSDDSAKAVRLLREMAEKQHKTFEEVFLDNSNAELVERTYTLAHRPNKSSPSYSELER